jgi:hypothetical protein
MTVIERVRATDGTPIRRQRGGERSGDADLLTGAFPAQQTRIQRLTVLFLVAVTDPRRDEVRPSRRASVRRNSIGRLIE